MFESDFTMIGKHATYMKFLVNNAKLYERYIDVYLNGAVFGLLYNRTAEKDKESKDTADIPASVFNHCRGDCMFLYRLVLLLDQSGNLDSTQKIDRTFRDDALDQTSEKVVSNLELFNAYVRGGIEQMYELFIDNHGITEDDYLERAITVMREFRDDVQGIELMADYDI